MMVKRSVFLSFRKPRAKRGFGGGGAAMERALISFLFQILVGTVVVEVRKSLRDWVKVNGDE